MPWKDLNEKGGGPYPPQRKTENAYGTTGRKILITTNHFEVTVKNRNLVIYHYDVEIKDHRGEEKLPKKKKMRIFEKMKESFPKVFGKGPISYDSMKNAYSTILIPQIAKKPQVYEVALDPEEGFKNQSKFKVKMVKVNQACLADLFKAMTYVQGKRIDMPTTVVQMMEVMFRHYRSLKYDQISGRSFFGLNNEFGPSSDIGGGKLGVVGFFASLRPAVWKNGSILLNLDMANTAYYKNQYVKEYIMETFEVYEDVFRRPLDFMLMKRIDKNLKGLKIRVTHANRTYKYLNMTKEGANALMFDWKDEKDNVKKVSVQKYMELQYKIRLQYPFLNCLHVGNPEKKIYIPIELCKIDKGQKVLKKLSDFEVSKFIRTTAVPPAQRLKNIMTVAAANKFSQDEMLNAMTFTICDKPLKTEGRVLPPPSLTMERCTLQPKDGVWMLRNVHKSGTIGEQWAVLVFDNRSRKEVVEKFIFMLVKMGKEKQMDIGSPMLMDMARNSPSQELGRLKTRFKDLNFVLCILPPKGPYSAIKVAGDKEHKIVTQCVVSKNVMKCDYQTIGNILLKINAKTGGVNNVVGTGPQFPSSVGPGLRFAEPILIMGADVNHPPAGNEKGMPSVAAVVGSCDVNATRYAVESRVQKERVEMIQDLTTITTNLLKAYRLSTGCKPQRIIMYRDGVSESQFREVLSFEMQAMRKACESLSPAYKPGITFICVQKRHHTRLFCEEKDGIGRSKNIPPGTIVDRDITHPTESDFFLCSHQGIQGTSKPTHYHLLWDDNDIPIDELQLLSYCLCHVYSRCSRSVSIPTPVYYAHLAAFRAKVHLADKFDDSDSGSTISGGSGSKGPSFEEIKRLAQVSFGDEMASRLYYI